MSRIYFIAMKRINKIYFLFFDIIGQSFLFNRNPSHEQKRNRASAYLLRNVILRILSLFFVIFANARRRRFYGPISRARFQYLYIFNVISAYADGIFGRKNIDKSKKYGIMKQQKNVLPSWIFTHAVLRLLYEKEEKNDTFLNGAEE